MVYWANGYYQIIQDVVGDCVYGNNPIASNLKGKPWANNVWQQTLWKFIPQSDGSFKIQSYYSREHQNQAIPSFRLASVVFSVFWEGLSGGEDFFHREWISGTQSHQRLHLIDSFSAAGFCVRFYDGIVAGGSYICELPGNLHFCFGTA